MTVLGDDQTTIRKRRRWRRSRAMPFGAILSRNWRGVATALALFGTVAAAAAAQGASLQGSPQAIVEIGSSGLRTASRSIAEQRSAAAPVPGVDWGKLVADANMARYPACSTSYSNPLGPWKYTRGLYHLGQYRLYRRLGDVKYLDYTRDWFDKHVKSDGTLTNELGCTDKIYDALDTIMQGRVLLLLWGEKTLYPGDPAKDSSTKLKFACAAYRMRAVLRADGTNPPPMPQGVSGCNTSGLSAYPKTTNHPGELVGAFIHSRADPDRKILADGSYMFIPFLADYGRTFNDATALFEAARQLRIYHTLLRKDNGLLIHASNDGAEQLGHSWGRAMGWYAMALVDAIDDYTQAVQINRQPPLGDAATAEQLQALLGELAAGLRANQDKTTGLWHQVVDEQTTDPDNWLETSSSIMISYALSKAVEHGWIEPVYGDVASRGFQAIVSSEGFQPPPSNAQAGISPKILLQNGFPNFYDISNGTVEQATVADYLAIVRSLNNLHGVAPFLTMWEQLGTMPAGSTSRWIQAETGVATPPMRTISDGTADGGSAIEVPPDVTSCGTTVPGAGGVIYRFNILKAGKYKVWGRIHAVSDADSLWVRVNAGNWLQWGSLPSRPGWIWDDVQKGSGDQGSALFYLAPGNHKLELRYCSPGTRLDKLLITDAKAYVPSNGGG